MGIYGKLTANITLSGERLNFPCKIRNKIRKNVYSHQFYMMFYPVNLGKKKEIEGTQIGKE